MKPHPTGTYTASGNVVTQSMQYQAYTTCFDVDATLLKRDVPADHVRIIFVSMSMQSQTDTTLMQSLHSLEVASTLENSPGSCLEIRRLFGFPSLCNL